MHTRRPLILALLVFTFELLGGCGGDGMSATTGSPPAPATWSTPTALFEFGGTTFVDAIQADPGGGVTVAWTDFSSGGAIPRFLVRPPAGSWALLPSAPVDTCCIAAAWTVGPAGINSVLVADRRAAFTGAGSAIATTDFAAGEWSPLRPLGPPAPLDLGSLAVLEANRATAFFPMSVRQAANNPAVTRYDPAAGWQPVEVLANLPGATGVFSSGGAIAADGRAMATWSIHGPGDIRLAYHTYRPGQGWSDIALVPIDRSPFIVVSAGADGSFFVSHSRRTTESSEILLSRLDADGAWGSATVLATLPLATSNGTSLFPRTVYQGAGGHILAFWAQEGGSDTSVISTSWSRYFDPQSGWSTPVKAPVPGHGVVQLAPSGKVVVASQEGISTLDSNGNWTTVDPPPHGVTESAAHFTAEPSGAITAVWTRMEGNRTIFMSSTYR